MNVRSVTLNEGPYDGMRSIVSHNTAVHAGEVYVWDGGKDPNRFVHALSAASKLSKEDQDREKELMRDYVANPTPVAPNILPWRFNMWLELFRYGIVE